jgi:type IV pilus biogenesis protein CpaD/CtpE
MFMGALTAWWLSACASSTPHYDQHFGESVRATLASQVINPAASANPNPVAGIDGRAAIAGQDHYERSFSQPTPPPTVLVNVR